MKRRDPLLPHPSFVIHAHAHFRFILDSISPTGDQGELACRESKTATRSTSYSRSDSLATDARHECSPLPVFAGVPIFSSP